MENTPFKCHVFICTNDRQGTRKACADNQGREIRAAIKTGVKDRGWLPPAVRVSQSGCLGLCEEGPNVMLYPQKHCFSGVTLGDVERIVDKIGRCLED